MSDDRAAYKRIADRRLPAVREQLAEQLAKRGAVVETGDATPPSRQTR